METPTQYFIVELDGQIEGMFQSNNNAWIAIEIAKLILEYPDIKITSIDKDRYESLLQSLDEESVQH